MDTDPRVPVWEIQVRCMPSGSQQPHLLYTSKPARPIGAVQMLTTKHTYTRLTCCFTPVLRQSTRTSSAACTESATSRTARGPTRRGDPDGRSGATSCRPSADPYGDAGCAGGWICQARHCDRRACPRRPCSAARDGDVEAGAGGSLTSRRCTSSSAPGKRAGRAAGSPRIQRGGFCPPPS